MSTIDELKGMASSKLGFARTNSFLVELPSLQATSGRGGLGGALADNLAAFVPAVPGLTPDRTPNGRELNILCKNAQLPGKQIMTHDRRIGMLFEKVAYGYAVGPVTLNFYLLNDYGVMNYFEEWRKKILDEESLSVGYKKGDDGYAKPIKIHQLRKPLAGISGGGGLVSVNVGIGGGSVYSVELQDAFPTTIGQIDFSNDLDGLVEVSVEFSYTNWKRIKPSQNFLNVSIGI